MELYLAIKKMTFEEDNIEHNIISSMSNKIFYGYDILVELPNNDKFIKDTLKTIYKKDDKGENTKEIEGKVFMIWENKSWISFPLYEIVNEKIVPFNYIKYQYFNNVYRRLALGAKINKMYDKSSENKILRKTLKHIMNILNIEHPDFFKKYDSKIEVIINKNPKEVNNGRIN